MTPGQARARARRGDGGQLRQTILDEAERLLVEKGAVSAVSVRAIATACDCTPPSIYLHFADKDELFIAVCTRRFEEFAADLSTAVAGIDGALPKIVGLARAYIAYGLTHPAQYRVLFGGTLERDPELGADDPGLVPFMLLRDSVERAIAEGSVIDRDPTTLAIGMWATMHGLVAITLNTPPSFMAEIAVEDPTSLFDDLLTTIMRGVLTDPNAAASVVAAGQ